MSREDMLKEGLSNLQKVDLYSYYENKTCLAPEFKVIPYDIPPGNLATYFPEANALVHIDAHDRVSETPSSKFIRVKIKKKIGA